MPESSSQRGRQIRTPLAAVILAATASSAYAADDSCPSVPTGDVYAYVCSNTSNLGDGVAIEVTNGQATASSTGLGGIDTAPLGATASQALLNGQFGVKGTSGAVATTQSEPVKNSDGSGTESASAGIGDKENATFTALPFASGNPTAAGQRISENVIVPSLHAAASGSATTTSGGVTVFSQGAVVFSDIISLSDQQFSQLHLSGVFVTFTYKISGSFAVNPTIAFGSTDGSFTIVLTPTAPSSTVSSAGGDDQTNANDESPFILPGQTFTVQAEFTPGHPVAIYASLGAEGTAVANNGIGASYDANLSDTAAFLGASFFADAADTIPLPDLQLDSALGFDYIPTDAIISATASPVPEPGTWALLLAGMGGLGSLRALRRKAQLS